MTEFLLRWSRVRLGIPHRLRLKNLCGTYLRLRINRNRACAARLESGEREVQMMSTLQGRSALVTGASRGIGRATASALANAGAHVLVHYGRSAQDAESLVAGIRSKGGRANAIRADLGTPEGPTLLAKEVRSIVGERLDVLVSNAGISKAGTVKDHTAEDFDNLFATNVRSPFFLVQQLLPVLGEGSNIIVISSLG